jgi:hypothetical protein
VRALTKRLAEADERVQQKSEQVRWLKEMTKLEARRPHLGRWINGPILRAFNGWKRMVREARREALSLATLAAAAAETRARELQSECDLLFSEHSAQALTLDYFLQGMIRARVAGRVRGCFRRWAALRPVGQLAAAAAAARAMGTMRALAARRHQPSLTGLVHRARARNSRIQTRHAFSLLKTGVGSVELSRAAIAAILRQSQRSALRRWLAAAAIADRRARGCLSLSLRARRASCRQLLSRWVSFYCRVVRGRRQEATAAAVRAREAEEVAGNVRAELARLRAVRSLWGEDELPAMIQALVRGLPPTVSWVCVHNP